MRKEEVEKKRWRRIIILVGKLYSRSLEDLTKYQAGTKILRERNTTHGSQEKSKLY